MAPTLLSWNTREYEFREKSVDWFWALGIGALAVIIAAIIFKNFLLAALVLVAALSIALIALREPKDINCEITEKGVRVEEVFYPFQNLVSFSVDEDLDSPQLILLSEKILMPHIIIPLGDEDPNLVRSTLLKFLKEDNHKVPLIDILADRLGF